MQKNAYVPEQSSELNTPNALMTPSAACGVRYKFFRKMLPESKKILLKKNFIICLKLYGNDTYF